MAYRLLGVPPPVNRMPRSSRINAGPLLGIALIASTWVMAAAVAFL